MRLLPETEKKDFADVTTIRILRWEVILDHQGALNAITGVLVRERQGRGEI